MSLSELELFEVLMIEVTHESKILANPLWTQSDYNDEYYEKGEVIKLDKSEETTKKIDPVVFVDNSNKVIDFESDKKDDKVASIDLDEDDDNVIMIDLDTDESDLTTTVAGGLNSEKEDSIIDIESDKKERHTDDLIIDVENDSEEVLDITGDDVKIEIDELDNAICEMDVMFPEVGGDSEGSVSVINTMCFFRNCSFIANGISEELENILKEHIGLEHKSKVLGDFVKDSFNGSSLCSLCGDQSLSLNDKMMHVLFKHEVLQDELDCFLYQPVTTLDMNSKQDHHRQNQFHL